MQPHILKLIGTEATFLRDRPYMTHPSTGVLFYDWRAGDRCHICGLVQFPDDSAPCLLVLYGDDRSEYAEIPLSDLSTELATADRRQPLTS